MSHRFFSQQPIADQQHIELDGQEAHHLLHVMRATPGTKVQLFDGSGRQFRALVTDVGRKTVGLEITDAGSLEPAERIHLTLAVALPKGERQRFLVEKCVELGVSQLVPLVTERSVAVGKSGSVNRLQRTVIEASKQCGRNRLMEIAEPIQLAHYLESARATWRILADPTGAATMGDVLLQESDHDDQQPTAMAACVGPEGGFSENELITARQTGWTILRLGRWVLRVETAAVALATLAAWHESSRGD